MIFLATFLFTYAINAEAREFKSQFPVEAYRYDCHYDCPSDFDDAYQWYEDTIWGHLAQMEECMIEAKEISILMPCTNDREKASILFKVVMAGFIPTLPQQKLLAMGMVFVTEYLPACADEWHRLVALIEEARYHSEMAIFYNNVFRHRFNESQF
jgi:hypothetical protein